MRQHLWCPATSRHGGLSIGAAYGAQLSTSADTMCCLCCRCELCSLKPRTINSTTPCVLTSFLTLRIFPSHSILDLWWGLFNAPTLSLLLFCSSYFGSLTVKSAQWIDLQHIVRSILSFHPLLRLYSMLLP